MWTQYFGKLNGESFAKVVKKDSPKAFWDSINSQNKLFLQDGEPIKIAKKLIERLMRLVAFDAIVCKVFAIPARSTDVNPIENIFNQNHEKLTEDAITYQIKRKNFEDFPARVERTFTEFPV